MPKSTWGDASVGDDVVLNDRTYRVRKAKRKGKVVKVTLERAGQSFTSEVRAKDAVKLVTTPLHDKEGRATRWAKSSEAEPIPRGKLGKGDASVTRRPEKPSGDPWESPRDRIERKLDEVLGAVLIAEGDESVGYYVPPVDVTTVAAHLVLMHGAQASDWDERTDLVALHRQAHDDGDELPVNHWHTKSRPKA